MSRERNRALRRRAALLGIFVILFQAVLFGWHHHPLVLPSHDAQPVFRGEGSAPLSPAEAEDDCDICQVLHHLNSAPAEPLALAAPAATAAPHPLPGRIVADRAAVRVFQARAPPRA